MNKHFRVHHAPANGERVTAEIGALRLGGRGANQAVAVARSGVHAALFGVVGDDSYGERCLATLQKYGVDTATVRTIPGEHTAEVMCLETEDDKSATIEAAAIDRLNAPTELIDDLVQANVILVQGGLYPSVTREIANLDFAGRFVLNLTPVRAVSTDTLAKADPLIVNEAEAVDLLERLQPTAGLTVESGPEALAQALRQFAKSVVLSFGARGCVFADGTEPSAEPTELLFQPSSQLEVPLDNVGAGDAFVGALAAALATGADLAQAVRDGCAAGALATRRHGRVSSFASAEEIADLVEQLPAAEPVRENSLLRRAQR